jgi:photosystem II stability/assembly factor-like uncharacterized protein
MQLRRSILLAILIILFIYFEIHSCSKDEVMGPGNPEPPLKSIICEASDVYFLDSNHGWVTGSLGTVMNTTNGGKTWEGLVVNDGVHNDIQFIDKMMGWVVGKDGDFYKTEDGGASWTKLVSSGYPSEEDFYKVDFLDDKRGFVLGYQGVYRTENGGEDWANNWLPVVAYKGTWDMSFPNDSVGYLLGSRWTDQDPVIIYKTVNRGENWSGVAGSKASVLKTVLTISFVDELTGWAGGGVIMKTMDGGQSWRTQVASATVREFFFLTDSFGFAVGGRAVLRTSDGGETWEDVAPQDERIDDLRSVFFLNERSGWIVGRGKDETSGQKLLKHSILMSTTDGGDSWTIKDFSFDYTAFAAE